MKIPLQTPQIIFHIQSNHFYILLTSDFFSTSNHRRDLNKWENWIQWTYNAFHTIGLKETWDTSWKDNNLIDHIIPLHYKWNFCSPRQQKEKNLLYMKLFQIHFQLKTHVDIPIFTVWYISNVKKENNECPFYWK